MDFVSFFAKVTEFMAMDLTLFGYTFSYLDVFFWGLFAELLIFVVVWFLGV